MVVNSFKGKQVDDPSVHSRFQVEGFRKPSDASCEEESTGSPNGVAIIGDSLGQPKIFGPLR